ncbi:hypothetical protein KAM329D_35290 [Aeromonas caviae]|uniref:Uncharacterized protein n=1 Tax=Aeromonas caviae TaxID=648 RepID=A0AAV4YQY6_AERCA|nr:hypothetical protein KAM329_031050 [Aeromonas caviae]BDA19133.1 hypothetical protein KAM345_030470 [Aeromonas caviae]BDO07650.1 hypothetical protein KAM643c_12230 [Aeromonas caviae]BDS29655.1 hypothetical protein KAM479c_13790 [Aeromonas caviae]GJA11320.1 hypothetical protein KAM334_26310 [Aeromonas caviae]
MPEFQAFFQTGGVRVHQAIPRRQADGIRLTVRSSCTVGAPVRDADGWRRPARAGRKAMICPMEFLTKKRVS